MVAELKERRVYLGAEIRPFDDVDLDFFRKMAEATGGKRESGMIIYPGLGAQIAGNFLEMYHPNNRGEEVRPLDHTVVVLRKGSITIVDPIYPCYQLFDDMGDDGDDGNDDNGKRYSWVTFSKRHGIIRCDVVVQEGKHPYTVVGDPMIVEAADLATRRLHEVRKVD